MIIFAIKKFCHYLLGNKFVLFTDHRALRFILNKPNPTGRIARWILLLQEFDFEIIDRPGKKHINADALTRAYDDVGSKSEDDDFPDACIFAITSIPIEYEEIWNYLAKYEFPPGVDKKKQRSIAHKSRPYSVLGNILYYQGGDGLYRQAISKDEGKEMLKEFHEGLCGGHYVGKATAHKILVAGYYWPCLFKDAYQYCRTCDVCCKSFHLTCTLAPHCSLRTFQKVGDRHCGSFIHYTPSTSVHCCSHRLPHKVG